MKTQINTLKRGNQFIAGSNHKLREQIGNQVKSENGACISIRYKNIEISLTYWESTTGKTWGYVSSDLPVEVVEKLVPGDTKAIKRPELVHYSFRINSDMTCELCTSRRRNENAWWKPGQIIKCAESDVVIL